MNVAEVVTSFTRAYNAVTGRGRIERLCEQLRWDIDGRDGDVLTLNFKCPLIGARPVYISSGDEPLVLFWSSSLTVFPKNRVPDYFVGYALFGNSTTPLGKWQANFNQRGDVYFSHTYTALGEGLDAAALKYICSTIATEVSSFDTKMQEKGYL